MAIFERGDIVSLQLDSPSGQERRLALVISLKDFNKLGDVLVAPITQSSDLSRYAGFAVVLGSAGCKTQGAALVNKVLSVDLTSRKARRIERAPQMVMDEAIGRLTALLS